MYIKSAWVNFLYEVLREGKLGKSRTGQEVNNAVLYRGIFEAIVLLYVSTRLQNGPGMFMSLEIFGLSMK